MPVFSFVGKSVARFDGLEKATGRAVFVGDLSLPGMLWGKILRSPLAHARIVGIDTGEAERVPGVKAVLTHRDVPKHPSHMGHHHPPLSPDDRYILDDRVRYVGHEVAAVAADSLEAAEEAVEKIRVEYEPLPAVFNPQEAMRPGAPRLHVGGERGIYDRERNIANHLEIAVGDVEAAFRDSAHVFGPETFRTSAPHHAQLEPHAVLASADPQTGRVTIWATTQAAFHYRRTIASALGMRESDIRVIAPYIGGGFGGKMPVVPHGPIAVLLSRKTGRPVKIVLTREEVLGGGTGNRSPAILQLKLGTDPNGHFTAFDAKITMSTGGYAIEGGAVIGVCCTMLTCLYKFPAFRVTGDSVYTNCPPSLGFRGFGNPQGQWALEQLVDMAAEELGLDPLEIRRRNQVRVGDTVPSSKNPLKTCGLEECMDRGAELIGWKRREDPAYRGKGAKRKGIGMAAVTQVSGLGGTFTPYPEVSNAVIKMNDDGTFNLMMALHEMGEGIKTVILQIAAEELGVRIDDIKLSSEIDTDVCPFDHGSFATRTTYVCGSAAKLAAADARKQILKKVAEKLDTKVENLEMVEGKIYVRGDPETAISLRELAEHIRFHDMEDAGTIVGRGSFTAQANSPPFGAQFAEVEVDMETGEVQLLRFAAVHDVGTAINPQAVEGQIEGGVAQGIGYALTEDTVIDPRTGEILTASFLDYKIPSSLDMPPLYVALVEPSDPYGPYGAKGAGEPPIVPTAPAIANAIANAIGVRIKSLPMTPEKILKALKKL
jgi:xanthine dehydrogenase molybdenum-binding subunit